MKVAVITGASRGIGECLARGLAKDGFALALVGRNKKTLEKLANSIRADEGHSAPPVVPGALEVQDTEAVDCFINSISERFGRVDLLINNAGIDAHGTLDSTAEEFENVLAVNLKGAFNFLKAVVPIMKKHDSGLIINIASRAGKIGFSKKGVYGASKFGLVGLGESLYRELSPTGIRVTTLCPSWVYTDMTKDAGVPEKEMLESEDLLKTVRWLLTLSPAACVKELVIECNKHIL